MNFLSKLAETTKAFPDKKAIVEDDEFLTYQRLENAASQVAQFISQSIEVSKWGVVAIFSDHLIPMAEVMIGALKSGQPYLLIDPSLPQEWVKSVMNHTTVKAFFALDDIGLELSAWLGHQEIKIFSPEDWASITFNTTIYRIQDHDPAYVISTSGTTGQGKLFVQSYGNLGQHITNYLKVTGIEEKDHVSFVSSLYHDAGIMDLYSTIAVGASLFRFKVDELAYSKMINRLTDYKITVWHSIPDVYRRVFKVSDPIPRDHEIRKIILGGGLLGFEDLKVHKALFENTDLINLYGMTECSVISHARYSCGTEYDNISVGLPVEGVEFHVVDPEGYIQEEYEEGEVVLSSFLIAEVVKEKDEFGTFKDKKQVYFKTGDIGFFGVESQLVLSGRKDNQVKIKGFRVELEGVDSHALHMKGVHAVAAQYFEKEDLLTLFYESDEAIGVRDWLDLFRASLPHYMIPGRFIHHINLPKTSSGKIKRKVLYLSEEGLQVSTCRPTNGLEMSLVEVWSRHLNVQEGSIGIDKDFFELGGHSLKALDIIADINQAFQVELPLQDFFSNLTIASLARHISILEKKQSDKVVPVEKAQDYPVSSQQKRQFFLQSLYPTSTRYNLQSLFIFDGMAEEESLVGFFKTLMQGQESLRSSFQFIYGELRQIVHQAIDLNINFRSKSGLSTNQLLQVYKPQFDLEKGPLFSVDIEQEGEGPNYMILNIHHMIADGHSMIVMIDELAEFIKGEAVKHPTFQYQDFTNWQRRQVSTSALEKQRQFWLQEFDRPVEPVSLTSDFNRSVRRNIDTGKVGFILNKEEIQNARRMLAGEQVTLFIVFLSLYSLLLGKLSGLAEVVIGVPVKGRSKAEFDNIIGIFVNTLAIRCQLFPKQSFKQFLEGLKEKILLALDHQDYPFADLVEELKVERDITRNPLFDHMIVWQGNDVEERIKGDFTHKDLYVGKSMETYQQSELDTSLLCYEGKDEIILDLIYDRGLFLESTAQKFVSHLKLLFEKAMSNPYILLEDLVLVDRGEWDLLLGNHINRPIKTENIAKRIRETALQNLEMTALKSENQELTFSELNDQVERVAAYLQHKGVQQGTIVGLDASRSIETLIIIYSINRAGGVFLPVSAKNPLARRIKIKKDSDMEFWVSPGDLEETNESSLVKMLSLKQALDYEGEAQPFSYDPTRLIYVIYTSGTTGFPKGVAVSQEAVINRIDWMQQHYPLSKEDVVLNKTTLAFDVSIWEIFWPVMNGTSLCILPEGNEIDPPKLADTLIRNRVSVVHFVPSMLEVFLGHASGYSFAHLKQVYCSGEALLPAHLSKFYSIFSRESTRLTNLYGPTEATVDVTYMDCDQLQDEIIPIGKPIQNVSLYVVNDCCDLLPPGVSGELAIAGVPIQTGYLNRSALNALKYVKIDWLNAESLYLTGDRAKLNTDGTIEYLGRIDDQIKLRGQRIELGEIKSALLEIKGVSQAAVLLQGDGSKAALYSYFVSDETVTEDNIRLRLTQVLPIYMIPSNFIKVNHFPLSVGGKLDKAKLTKIYESQTTKSVSLNEGLSPIEAKLLSIWQKVLNKEDIVLDDNYFELGGNSLTMNLIVTKVEEVLEMKIKIIDLFEHTTIKKLALHLKRQESELNEVTTITRGEEDKLLSTFNNGLKVLNAVSKS